MRCERDAVITVTTENWHENRLLICRNAAGKAWHRLFEDFSGRRDITSSHIRAAHCQELSHMDETNTVLEGKEHEYLPEKPKSL